MLQSVFSTSSEYHDHKQYTYQNVSGMFETLTSLMKLVSASKFVMWMKNLQQRDHLCQNPIYSQHIYSIVCSF